MSQTASQLENKLWVYPPTAAAYAGDAETALRTAEECYRDIFEQAIDGIFQTAPDGWYLSVNPALAKLYGYDSPEDLLDHQPNFNGQLYVQPDRRREFVALITKCGVVSNFESQIYCRDGSIIWISETVGAVRDCHGSLLYYAGTVRDISELKAVEAEREQAWLKLATLNRQLEAEIREREATELKLRSERAKIDQLLANILPQSIVDRLKKQPQTIAESFADVTVLFADLVDFTAIAATLSPHYLVRLLNRIFSTFDALVEYHQLEKIKTIGDAYMAVGGLPNPRCDHAVAVAELALGMQAAIARLRADMNLPLYLRIGIHSGPVIAGVIGTKKFSYDLWGDTVNLASRMESTGMATKIQVSEATYEILKGKYLCQKRGAIAVKGKGQMTTYWLNEAQTSSAHIVSA